MNNVNMLKGFFKITFIKMITSLTLVGVMTSVSLVFVYCYAIPKIEINIKKETASAIEKIFPNAKKVELIMNSDIFEVKDSTELLIGYAFIAEGNGYQGTIKLIVGIDTEVNKLIGLEVLESQETPGLGAEIANPNFRKQFSGLELASPIEYVKNQRPTKSSEIEAITGATVSSSAVVSMLNKKVEVVRNLLQ